MKFRAFGEFVQYLDSIGELHRVEVEVDPSLEITEIAVRALKEKKPALYFSKVKGSPFPLVINAFASDRRIEHALGRHPQEIGDELVSFLDQILPPKPRVLWKNRKLLKRFLRSVPRRVSSGCAQDVVREPNISDLPVQTCWPKDGGRFITMGQVFTYDPNDGKRNVGLYRLQIFDEKTTGMHWQIERGGGFHYAKAEKQGKGLEVAVVLGTDPALTIATVAALPEGIDEVMFAGILRGSPIPLTKGKKVSITVPANAEFILEGTVAPKERRREGPFGDHFGHYSNAAPFPVLHVKALTHRQNPVYPATVVGIPPMEDKYLGDATQEILGPLVKLIHKEVCDIWAYYEAGFHNLLVVSVNERYKKEAMKAALGLLGTSQLSLTKCMVLVSESVNPRDWRAVLGAIRDNFDPYYDFVLLPKVPLDTLDFTSFSMELGSKMVLDATQKPRRVRPRTNFKSFHGRSLDRKIIDFRIIEDCLMIVKTSSNGRVLLEKLLRLKSLSGLSVIAVVSDDVNIDDQVNYIWGIFTRFDCERDVLFSEQRLIGISPVYRGVLGIDATWKKGYPETLAMDERIVRKVDERWDSYWR
jgi:4-hydroxy-3-polyprenylbenzoate decarboxylase